jgi:glycosyltransferase involved in cell wall biosynthesis
VVRRNIHVAAERTRVIPILYLHEHGEISGGENSLLILWERLDRSRFRPILAAPCPSPLADRARSLGVDVRAMSFPRMRDMMGLAGTNIIRGIRRLVQEEKVRILHGNTPRTNLLGSLAALGTGCRVVWHERTLPEAEWDVDRWLRFLPDRIICNSAAVAERFRGTGKAVVILNGVPLDRFRPGAGGADLRGALGIGTGDVLVGIVGNFTPVKGHDIFIHAASRLATRDRTIRFWIVGGETFAGNQGRGATLRALVNDLGLEKCVQFLDHRDDMPAVMDALDILAVPSYMEACSRAILEAMAAGKPVVATNVGGNPELVKDGETGVLDAPRDVDALAEAIMRLVEDPHLRRRMGAAARTRAEADFSVVRQVRQTQALYADVLGSA